MEYPLASEVGVELLGQELLRDRHGDEGLVVAGLEEMRDPHRGRGAVGRGGEARRGVDVQCDLRETGCCRQQRKDAECRWTQDWL